MARQLCLRWLQHLRQPPRLFTGKLEITVTWTECLDSHSIDTPDAGESGMEMAGRNPPADIDSCVVPDVLPTAISVRTVVSDKSKEIDTPDAVVSSMEVAGGSPPAGVDISGGPVRKVDEY